MPISKKLEISLVAFNGSKNCVHESSESFYESYLARKAFIVKGKMEALKRGDMNVNKEKFEEEVAYLKEAKEQKIAVLDFIGRLERGKLRLEDAERLLGDLNLG